MRLRDKAQCAANRVFKKKRLYFARKRRIAKIAEVMRPSITLDDQRRPLLIMTSQPIVSHARKLKARWTIEAAPMLKAVHGMDIEDGVAKEMQREVDRQIVWDLRRAAARQRAIMTRRCNLERWRPCRDSNPDKQLQRLPS